ncbi:MAG: caspase domain-containing protein [Leptolyngbyaceae cyanobacterium]
MGKHILLIGVSTDNVAPNPIDSSPAIANITALKQALLADVEGLRDDHVVTLVNPNLRQMRHAIALMTYRCRHGDLCLIYYAGCGVIDPHSGRFYLTANDTQLDAIPATAVSSDYIRQALPSLQPGLNRVMILDCMWGSLSPQQGMPRSLEPGLPTKRLADCSCALFTAVGSNDHPWSITERGLSLYTQHLIEGISTGLADVDADGAISADDLQAYMAQALGATGLDIFPIALGPEDRDGQDSRSPLLTVRPYSPEREYRRCVEEYVSQGHISPVNRNILEFLRHQLGITLHQSQTIEADVMTPYATYQGSCDRYRQAFVAALALENPLGKPLKKWLKHLQGELSLSYEDVSVIESQASQAPYSAPLPQLPSVVPPKLPAYRNGSSNHSLG